MTKYFALDKRGELVAIGEHACVQSAASACPVPFITVLDEGGAKFWLERQSRIISGAQILRNPYLQAAYRDYMQARQMVQQGLLGNCSLQRESLRSVYRLLAGRL